MQSLNTLTLSTSYTPEEEAEKVRNASLNVCAYSEDVDEAKMFMQMLGLIDTPEISEESS